MRTGQLAELVGVTVRTIRYYHQAGVLPEPERLSNGYRDYTADHLVALLRIRELTATGLSLEQAGQVVANTVSGSVGQALDEVDRALEARIATLTEQHRRLTQARVGGLVGLSRLAAAMTVSPNDIPVATLVAHAYGEGDHVERLAGALHVPEIRAALIAVQERFDAIDADTTDQELDELTEQLQAVIDQFPSEFPPLSAAQSELIQNLLSCATLVHTLPGDVLEHRGSLVWNDGMDRVPLLAGTQYRRS